MIAVDSEVRQNLKCKIDGAQQMLIRCTSLDHVPGMVKLKKKIKAEINFLIKLENGNRMMKKEHLLCSNLIQLDALLDTVIKVPNVTSILKAFHSTSGRLLVDVVADGGLSWLKVIARNPQAMCQISLGQGQFGEKSIIDHAKDYLQFAAENPIYFVSPKVKFIFTNGVFQSVVKLLEQINVAVEGEVLIDANKPLKFHQSAENSEIENTCFNGDSAMSMNDVKPPVNVAFNLDVTSMLAYISSLTNGNCWYRFKEKVLDFQANCERANPVKPILDNLFEGRELICCQTAKIDFLKIVSTLGGEQEKERAQLLLKRIKVIPDCESERTKTLPLSSQIKNRSKIIFGTGDFHRAVTVTANVGFVRSAESKGINLAVFIHESRALTEAKQARADVLKIGKTNV